MAHYTTDDQVEINRVTDLIAGHNLGSLTAGQKQELKDWLARSEQNEILFQQLTSTGKLMEQLNEFQGLEHRIRARMNAIDGAADHTTAAPRVHFLRTIWLRYAAVLILIAGTGTFLYKTYLNSPEKLATVHHDKNEKADILPGSNKAILTLSDGSTIILDSAANGSLARQGNTNIIKLNNGRLAYHDATGATAGWNTVSTPNGGQYQVELPDGTRAWLNAGSSIRFPTTFSEAKRLVYVTGEVYLEVEKDVSRPFLVKVNQDAEIAVLGTSFNINAYTNEPSLIATLLTGGIRVTELHDARAQKVVLTPGQQAVLQSASLKVQNNVDAEQVMAWKNGYFHFDGMELPAVMRQLERWYNISVTYKGVIPKKHFGGELPRSLTLQQLIKLLQFGDVSVELKGSNITIIGD